MAKPKAPRWLTQAFVDGIDDREEVYRDGMERFRSTGKPYRGASPWCWLAHFDPVQRPCAGQPGKVIERFHFIPRQRVEAAMWEALRGATTEVMPRALGGSGIEGPMSRGEIWDLILLAAWDPRNGGLGCEHHHRRLDSHADSPSAPAIVIPAFNLPEHVDEFVDDYGLEQQAEDRFEGWAPLGEGDRAYLWESPR